MSGGLTYDAGVGGPRPVVAEDRRTQTSGRRGFGAVESGCVGTEHRTFREEGETEDAGGRPEWVLQEL